MRGARDHRGWQHPDDRIIPADAGSTCKIKTVNTSCRDHPRGCGEHANRIGWTTFEQGSSPRMRGAPLPPFLQLSATGIIPADAGSTTQRSGRLSQTTDHPRGCGEHGHLMCPRWYPVGSSPRMRGAPYWHSSHNGHDRIIPADAGSTLAGSGPVPLSRDHPRGCGEHMMIAIFVGPSAGSSPRMRGALTLGQQRCLEHRIIPADAGSTSPIRAL